MRMKRLARYLKNIRKCDIVMDKECRENNKLEVYVDSDWAGCRRTRKSTSGGVVMMGGCLVKSWSTTQSTIATSSGEAECYAMVRGASEALGMSAALEDLGHRVEIEIHVDSTAAKAISSRLGLGRLRHLEVRFLWLQEAVRRRRLVVKKVAGANNLADIFTKPKSENELVAVLIKMGVRVKNGES